MKRKQILKEIEIILAGIDEEETDTERGWWETSEGAAFGKSKLNKIRKLFPKKTRTPNQFETD